MQLYVSVPVASFRVAQAREYWESYPCPPPSTVYGMLLSVVGEEDRLRHAGAEIAIATLGHPERSRVLRTVWRLKDKKKESGQGNNRRPDFTELLTGVRFCVWVRPGKAESSSPALVHRLASAIEAPAQVVRFGGVALGESTFLVDELRPWRDGDPAEGSYLLVAARGNLTLPVWPDHVGSRQTRWECYQKSPAGLIGKPPDAAWTVIRPVG
jgi:CRISPR-associated protein Cas5t